MTLVEIVVAMGLIGGLSLGVMTVMSRVNRAGLESAGRASAQEIRRNMVAMLENEAAWLHTFLSANNGTFACLRKRSDCGPKAGGAFVVYDSSNTAYFDSGDPKLGYTLQGARCQAYPSRGCPLRPELGWRPLCAPGGACVPEQVELSGRVVYNPGPAAPAEARLPLNPENYSFRLIKNLFGGGAPLSPSPAPASPVASTVAPPGKRGAEPEEPPPEVAAAVRTQKKVMCNLVAPMLRGVSPSTIQDTMRKMGYSDDVVGLLERSLRSCD